MENIKQLEKAIEKWTYPYRDRSDKSSRVQEVYDYKKELLKAKLQTLKDVCKEIKKEIKYTINAKREIEKTGINKGKPRDSWHHLNGQDIILEELLKKFQGGEK